MDHATNALVEFVVLDLRREKNMHGCTEDHRIGILVDKDNVINYQLVISYRLLIKILTNQSNVDKTIALSTNC
jgi:hypothetical protein